MISSKLQDALNSQVTKEMFSSNIYLAMSSYFAQNNLNGCAHWMRIQADEETIHAMKIFDYILARGGQTKIGAIDAPPVVWESPLAAFEHAFEHEQYITSQINELMALAIEEKDYAATSFLQWFVDEQVEEEEHTNQIVEDIRIASTDRSALFFLDRELSQRVAATNPAPAKK